MDTSLHRQKSKTLPPRRFAAGHQLFDSILPLIRHSVNQLTSFVQLTDEEQKEAGICIGDQRYQEFQSVV